MYIWSSDRVGGAVTSPVIEWEGLLHVYMVQ